MSDPAVLLLIPMVSIIERDECLPPINTRILYITRLNGGRNQPDKSRKVEKKI